MELNQFESLNQHRMHEEKCIGAARFSNNSTRAADYDVLKFIHRDTTLGILFLKTSAKAN